MARRYKSSAAETAARKKREAAYYAALGRFVDLFSRIEVALQIVLWHYSKIKPETAKALLHGTRSDQAMNLIKRVLSVTDAPGTVRNELADIFQQTAVIRGVRNDILHLGAEDVAEGAGYVTNEMLAHDPRRIKRFPISAEILDDMTADLWKIMICLLTRHMGRRRIRGKSNQDMIDETLRAPWRYKHPVPPKSTKK